MRKFSKTVAFFLLISSIIMPVMPVVSVDEEPEPIIYRMASSALIVSGNWDPVISDGYNILSLYMFPYATEYPCAGYATYWAGLKGKTKEEEWWPMLCTSWDTVFRPVENNSHPLGAFNNSGGRESILFTLRQGVNFTDGSMWNASVMKWNIDRLYLISGNLTGNANGQYDQRNQGTYWDEVDRTAYYWSDHWNLSEYNAPNIGGELEPPDLNNFSYYYIGDPSDPANKVQNPYPYGGWDSVQESHILYTPYDQYPLIRWVEIVNPGDPVLGGGQVRVHWNSYNTYGMEGGCWTRMISMLAYKNYNETGYYGYNTGMDMIGTGPYKYESFDEISGLCTMVKNEDWWNNTANEAAGWGDVDKLEIVQFPSGELGTAAMNTALIDHEVDYAVDDGTFNPLDTETIKKNKNINYYDWYESEYITQITLNSINETWWSGGVHTATSATNPGLIGYDYSWVDINAWYAVAGVSANPAANGIPRPMRKALSYAFDYDTLIHTDLNDKVVRGGGMTGADNVFYNASVPIAYYNLSYAREILLNSESDPYSMTDARWPANADAHNWTKQLALRGLTDPTDSPANNLVWQNIAETNPIFTIEFFWDDHHQDLKDKFELACNNLGVALVDEDGVSNKASPGTRLWDQCVSTYWSTTFDGVHSIWSAQAWPMDYNYPMTIPEGWFFANYGDPDMASWRETYYPVGASPAYWPTWNFGFSYDVEVDYWLAVMFQSEPHRKLESISKIAYKEQNELYSMLWAYQGKLGMCLWSEWETFWVEDRDESPNGFWGVISPQFLKYAPKAEEFAQIPGAPLTITLAVTGLSIFGIVYLLMRKKRAR
ncbi:MAG: ABC transporter substrate-binding protein [Promethearchaeota archaeon]